MQGPQAVVGSQFCAPYATEFTVVKKALSFSHGDFLINDSHGNLFFKVEGRVMSIRNRRALLDNRGQPVARAIRKIVTLHDRWNVYRGDGSDNDADRLFTVKKSSLIQFRTSLDVFLAYNTNERNPDYVLKGNFFERSCTVYRGNEVVAEVRRKFTAGNILLGKDTFVIVVFPGIDYAFIVMLIVLMDEIHREDTNDS